MKKAIVFLGLSVLLFSNSALAQNLPSYLPTNGLVGWWPFNGNANDESGNGNHGTVNGATLAADRQGNANSSYYFDGASNNIEVDVTSLPINNSSRTISSWFKTSGIYNENNVSPYQFIQAITAYGSSQQGLVIFVQYLSAPTGQSYFESGSSQNQIYSLNPCNDGIWHNLTTVYDNSNMLVKMYVDGIFNSSTNPIALETVLSTFGIGKTPWYDIYFNGQIDDIAIYNRALTQEEITALYTGTPNNGGGGSSSANPVPPGIPYQAVVRNANGGIAANAAVTSRFTLHQTTADGAVEYQETHALTTNAQGLMATVLGQGTAVQNTFAAINWANTAKFLQVEVDLGNGYVDLGTQQLMSVPFAQRAAAAGTIENGTLPIFSDNAAALAGGLSVGKLYRTSTGDLKIVY